VDRVGDGQWHLHDIASDPGETQDLSDSMPERFASMLALYSEYVRTNGVLPVAEDYAQVRQVAFNGLRSQYGGNILLSILTVLTLIPFYVFHRFANHQRRHDG